MTIKKTGLSLAAMALVTTGLVAANLNVTSSKTFANELVTVQDYNGTEIVLDANSTTVVPTNLVGGISAGNGKINLIFSGARIGSAYTAMKVYNIDRNSTVGINPTLSSPQGSTIKSQLTFDVNDTINNGDTLFFSDAALLSDVEANSSIVTTTVPLDILKDTSVINMKVQFANVSAAELDVTPEKAVYTGKDQWTVAITTKFNALIDATADFYKFTTTNSTTTVDAGKLTFTSTAPTLAANATMKVRTTADTNVSLVATWADTTASGNQFTAASTGYELNATSAVNATAYDLNASVAGSNTNEIKETQFTVSVDANFTNSGQSTLLAATTSNFGAWTIYGYNAKIPNVVAVTNIDTTMKFTNRSALDTDIYFTLVDRDGTIAKLNSSNTSLSDLKDGSTGTYKASAIVALLGSATITETDTSTAGFDSTGSFSVEVSIPTTPSSVYGMASFKNSAGTIAQFKDLPVYSNNTAYSY